MTKSVVAVCVTFSFASLVYGAEVQGVVIDRDCAQDILKYGRQVIVKKRRECSLMKDYVRSGYGIVTDARKFLRFDNAGNRRVVELLRNTSERDNLKVIVTGDIDGDTIKVTEMSLL